MKSLSEAEFKRLKELYDLAEKGFRSNENELVNTKEYVLAITDRKDRTLLQTSAGHVVCDLIKEELNELYMKRKKRHQDWVKVNQKYSEQRKKHGNV